MDKEITSRPSPQATHFVCDTEYCSPRTGLDRFCATISDTFMPWTLQFEPEEDFCGRVEGLAFGDGAVARLRTSPMVATRGSLELAHSDADCFFANYVISGTLNVEQGKRRGVAHAGDLVLFDSSQPVVLREINTGPYEELTLRIAKTSWPEVDDAGAILDDLVIPADKMIGPLLSCLSVLTEDLRVSPREELMALHDAFAHLLPIAANHARDASENTGEVTLPMMRELTNYIQKNIGDPELSPRSAAKHLGISARYVHKQFSASGTTFGNYLTTSRLEHVGRDLISPDCRRQPIFVIAYKWGFSDLSTFIRAFKKKFGCAPSQFRVQP